MTAFESGVQADGLDVEILNNLGYAYLLQGRLDEAVDTLREALLRDPKRVNAWVNLGQVFAAKNHAGQAAASFVLALRLSANPDKTRAFLRDLAAQAQSPKLREILEQSLAHQ